MNKLTQSLYTPKGQQDPSVFFDKVNGHATSKTPSMQWLVEMDYKDNNTHRTLPFSPALWKALEVENSSYLELSHGSKLYEICHKYVLQVQAAVHPEKKLTSNSFGVETTQKATFFDPENILKNVKKSERNNLTLGTGLHEIEFEGQRIRILLQTIGDPVGTSCGVEVYRAMVIFVDRNVEGGGAALLKRFCDALIEFDERTIEKVYKIHVFNSRHQFWQEMATKLIRPLDSVILPSELKGKILADIDSFVSVETAGWYFKHGISYKRTYLFYGPPGAGKSSFIRVLAGHLGKNLCFLQPANPGMTDESLQRCMQTAPENSIIVMEDIDALFDKDRAAKSAECPLTFSGLLNALDGVCNRDGQIFVLTTNFIDRLDTALVRPGRVDMRVEFPHASAEQVKSLYLHFYPDEHEMAAKFTEEIERRFRSKEFEDGRLNLSMAALQQHFIVCRTSSAAEAVERLSEFSGEM